MAIGGTTKTVTSLTSANFEQWVRETFPFMSNYSFQAEEEISNGQSKTFNVTGCVTDNDRQAFDEWVIGRSIYCTVHMLEMACLWKLIKPGEYIVTVGY